jgi:hypothetical protein
MVMSKFNIEFDQEDKIILVEKSIRTQIKSTKVNVWKNNIKS